METANTSTVDVQDGFEDQVREKVIAELAGVGSVEIGSSEVSLVQYEMQNRLLAAKGNVDLDRNIWS